MFEPIPQNPDFPALEREVLALDPAHQQVVLRLERDEAALDHSGAQQKEQHRKQGKLPPAPADVGRSQRDHEKDQRVEQRYPMGEVGRQRVHLGLETFGLEPREIATLLEQREAMLHGIREGAITVDAAGNLTICAILLHLSRQPAWRGRLFPLYLSDYMGRLVFVALFPFLQRDRGLTDTQCGPVQVNFLRYRPVLSNKRLKEVFGYTPQKTTRDVFEFFLECRKRGG